ncbi:PQQ-dependent sugar dehydrogenase [Catellatospora sichuanensis]|uniref:PQQ-dependent sugar dehydrogenase n=1 Tax=Catellatospora sichuanensis TaxID=1969805 RepID=UPI0011832BA2|nr:PQQ-dependent sugar dehydrogenase [Catellatospora sichuanensis]
MTPVAPSPVESASGGSRLISGLLLIAVVGLAVLVVRWPEPPPDVQPPSAPGALSLGETTCKSVALSWAGSTDDTDVTGYEVHRDGRVVTTVGGATRSVVITEVPAGTWSVQVKARDEAGNVSPAGETVSVTPPQCGSDAKAPSTPGGVKATADGTTVTMTWDAATDDVEVAAYDVFRNGAKVGTVAGAGGPQFSFIDLGVPASAGHRYQVSARDGQGNVSSRSAGIDVTAGSSCTLLCAVTPVAKDTGVVWGLVELPDGSVLYGRRDTHEIVRMDPRSGQVTPLGVVPGAASTGGDGGLLSLAVAATFAKDRWIYVFFSTASDNRIVRLRLRGDELDGGSMQSLVVGIPRGKFHNGGRLRFGRDGKLYAATGDAGNPRLAQDQRSLAGKVLRFNPDGTVPAGNPFGGYIWSLGHRNPQGLAFDARGRLWVQESGDAVADETNLVVKGGNYGWPACEGTESKSGAGCATPGFVAPQHTFAAGEGSCGGMAFVRNVVYLACAGSSRLYRAELDGDALANVQAVLVGAYGQLYTAEPGAGGTLWVVSGGTAAGTDMQILRITLPSAA